MKTNVSLFNIDDNLQISKVIRNTTEYAVKSVAEWMWWLSVDEVNLNIVSKMPIIAHMLWSGRDNPPEPVKYLRQSLLSQVIKPILESFGINKISINLSDQEVTDRDTYWKSAIAGNFDYNKNKQSNAVSEIVINSDPTNMEIVL